MNNGVVDVNSEVPPFFGGYKKAKLQIDSRDAIVSIDGWADESSDWNGWSYVLMNKENALKLAGKLSDVIRYDESKDEFVEIFDDNSHESEDDLIHWPSFKHDTEGQIYSIGSGYWCWTHEFPSEFDNMHHALKEFIKSANNLLDNWDNEYPTVYKDRKYPSYLPSFDEFIMDMGGMVLPETDKRLAEWRKTIQ